MLYNSKVFHHYYKSSLLNLTLSQCYKTTDSASLIRDLSLRIFFPSSLITFRVSHVPDGVYI